MPLTHSKQWRVHKTSVTNDNDTDGDGTAPIPEQVMWLKDMQSVLFSFMIYVLNIDWLGTWELFLVLVMLFNTNVITWSFSFPLLCFNYSLAEQLDCTPWMLLGIANYSSKQLGLFKTHRSFKKNFSSFRDKKTTFLNNGEISRNNFCIKSFQFLTSFTCDFEIHCFTN